MAQETHPGPKHVLVTGGTGFIGRHLIRGLLADGIKVTVLSRDVPRATRLLGAAVRVTGSLERLPDDCGIDAVVNLAGAPIFGPPWTQGRRQRLLESRLGTTDAVVALCRRLQTPRVLVSASAIGYYGISDGSADETTPAQDIFQSRLCHDWEASAIRAEDAGLRVARLRFGIVLGRDGGALPPLALPLRLGFGTILGDGRQGMPWLHIDDAVGLIRLCLEDSRLSGAVNAVAPAQTTHAEFMTTLGRVLHRPVWLRVPAFLLRSLLGEMAQLFVDGRPVLPTVALGAGYRYRFATLESAFTDLFGRQASDSNR